MLPAQISEIAMSPEISHTGWEVFRKDNGRCKGNIQMKVYIYSEDNLLQYLRKGEGFPGPLKKC